MKTIFECETEIGQCADHLPDLSSFDAGGSVCIYAHTQASLTGMRGMLKIEKRCYLRQDGEIADQTWLKPEIILEPALSSEKELIAMVRRSHEEFTQKARDHFAGICSVQS